MRSRRRHIATGLVIVARGIFEQGLIEVIAGALGVTTVVGGDCEDIFAELQFERGAGFGDVCAGLGEFSLGIDLALAGIGEVGKWSACTQPAPQ